MKPFMDKDFLLSTPTARTLYHDYAAQMPIIDYHCHINPQEIFEDRRFENITQVWLGGDHYKWRVMRSNGVEEKYITGDASDREKFQKFAEALPKAIGNPMYHWCHLELQRYFGYTGVLNGDTAEEVWNLANEKLRNDPNMTVRGLVRQSNVYMVGTTDDPCDSLEWHKKIAEEGTFETKVCPSFRPDKALNIDKPGFVDYIHQLEKVVGREFSCIHCVRDALGERIDFFNEMGCRASDHGLDYVMYRPADDATVSAIFPEGHEGRDRHRGRSRNVQDRSAAVLRPQVRQAGLGYAAALLLHAQPQRQDVCQAGPRLRLRLHRHHLQRPALWPLC